MYIPRRSFDIYDHRKLVCQLLIASQLTTMICHFTRFETVKQLSNNRRPFDQFLSHLLLTGWKAAEPLGCYRHPGAKLFSALIDRVVKLKCTAFTAGPFKAEKVLAPGCLANLVSVSANT